MSKTSAVILLHEHQTDSLILTQRSTVLREHPGEICFPGGRWELSDKDLWATALRELYEELGIEERRIQRIKALNPEITLRGAIIHPWLASIDSIEPYCMNVQEVAAVLTLPMQDVLNQKNYKPIFVERSGKRIKSLQFIPSEQVVWGATARIMRQLCQG